MRRFDVEFSDGGPVEAYLMVYGDDGEFQGQAAVTIGEAILIYELQRVGRAVSALADALGDEVYPVG